MRKYDRWRRIANDLSTASLLVAAQSGHPARAPAIGVIQQCAAARDGKWDRGCDSS